MFGVIPNGCLPQGMSVPPIPRLRPFTSAFFGVPRPTVKWGHVVASRFLDPLL